MPYHHLDLRVSDTQPGLAAALRGLRNEFKLPGEFPPEVLAEALYAVASQELPDEDLTELAFVTIDPPGTTDLDQALHLERMTGGYRLWYAIADVPSFVVPGGALDAETRRRAQTVYAPDGRIPLHPEIIGVDAGSLLPGALRSAYVWEFRLNTAGVVASTRLRRARIKSRAQLSYAHVQQVIDAGGAPPNLRLLKEVGMLREDLERARGGAVLNLTDREVTHDGQRYVIASSPSLPVEGWNAQISLLTGMAAAQLMLDGRVGILRTMPAPNPDAINEFRSHARALGQPWPAEMAYGEFLRNLDTTDPPQLALMHAAAPLFRGAGYTAFDGELPEERTQSAVAAPYAHTTAPLRRLVDRFVLVICAALSAGTEVPGWARDALPELNTLMNASNQAVGQLQRAAINAVEAAVLSNRVGFTFDAVVINGSRTRENGDTPHGTIQLSDSAIEARCDGDLETGAQVRARLVRADVRSREVRFEVL